MTASSRILFFGTPVFAETILQALVESSTQLSTQVAGVITQPDRPTGRGLRLSPPPVKSCALSHRIPVWQPASLRKSLPEFFQFLSEIGPIDLGVVVAFGQILPLEVLNAPRLGCINIHASLLPRWRGAAPIHRAIVAGDKESGVCLMQMDEGLDTGPIFSSVRTDITDSDTAGTLHDRLAQLGANLLLRDLGRLLTGTLSPTPQPEDGVTYAHKISPQEACVNFATDAVAVSRQIRGLAPLPGAFCFLHSQRLKLFDARADYTSEMDREATPGLIVQVTPDEFAIACSSGRVVCRELQCEGRGSALKVGDRLMSHSI
jgi:methionyl-tRNA formyltransferase